MSIARWVACAVLAGTAVAPLQAQTRPQERPPTQPRTSQVRPAAARSQPPVSQPEWYYLPGPPDFVAGAMVESARWSPDGRYVLAARQEITLRSLEDVANEPSLVLWNAGTQASTVVWRVASADYTIRAIEWLPGTSVAFVVVHVNTPEGGRNTLWRVDARRATASEVPGFGPDDSITVSPLLPLAVVYGQELRSLDAAGQMGAPMLPAQASMFPMGWSPDGARLILPGLPEDGEERTFWALDPVAGSATSSQTRPKLGNPPERKWPFRLEAEKTGREGDPSSAPQTPWNNEKVRPLWLVQGDGPSADRSMLTADVHQFSISPKGDAVLYTCREGCFVAPLVRIGRAEVERARDAARRAMLMSNGKQIALGALMYSMDNDEMMPPAGSDLRTLLEPYTKSPDIFNGMAGPGDGFVYTFPGGPMNQVETPADTEMGFIPAPGGRVVVWMDGHVTYQPAGS